MVQAKQRRVIELLPFVARCARGRAVLVGGTALALFYLGHRASIDMDFAVGEGNAEFAQELKGCLSRTGFQTKRTAHRNVFTVHFPETAVRVEVFVPEGGIGKTKEFELAGEKILVASPEELLRLKLASYKDRGFALDLFDMWALQRHMKKSIGGLRKLARKRRPVDDVAELRMIGVSDEMIRRFSSEVL